MTERKRPEGLARILEMIRMQDLCGSGEPVTFTTAIHYAKYERTPSAHIYVGLLVSESSGTQRSDRLALKI